MNFPIDYKEEINCEDVGNTMGVFVTNGVQKGKSNSCYMSYAESTISTIKFSMDSPQECVGGTQCTEVSGRNQIMGFLRTTGLSHMVSAKRIDWQSDRL